MKRSMFSLCVMIIGSTFLFVSSALAQYGYVRDEGKVLFEVEGWWVTPTGMGFDFATLNEGWYEDELARGGGDILGIELDSKFSGKYTLAWKFKEDLGTLSISYWDYSGEGTFSKEGNPGNYSIGELLAHPYYAGQGYYDPVFQFDTGRADAVQSMATVEATLLDIDFSKEMMSDQNFSLLWSVGLRNFKYSHLFHTTYLGDPYARVAEGEPLEVLDMVTDKVESDGTGPKVGLSGRYSFMKYFSIYGGLSVSFIPGKIDSSYLSENDIEKMFSDDVDEWGPFNFPLSRLGRDENFIMYDFQAGFKMAIAQKLSLTVGYRLVQMANVIYRMRFAPDKDWDGYDLYVNWDSSFNTQQDVTFGGYYVGVSYTF